LLAPGKGGMGQQRQGAPGCPVPSHGKVDETQDVIAAHGS